MPTLSRHTLTGPTHTVVINPTYTKVQHHYTVIIDVPPGIQEVLMSAPAITPRVLEGVDGGEVEGVDDVGPIDVETPAVELFRNDTKQGLFVGVLLLLTGVGGWL